MKNNCDGCNQDENEFAIGETNFCDACYEDEMDFLMSIT